MTDLAAPYDVLGGETAVRDLTERFYDIIEERYPLLREMLPADTSVSRRKLFEYLSGWLGGPPLYVERYGHPRLRMRHLPFRIDTEAARQWIEAMYAALDDTLEGEVDAAALDLLRARLLGLAAHMRNTPDPEPAT